MKDNKSPGVDGIPPKLVIETVEEIKLAKVFNLSLKEGLVLFEWGIFRALYTSLETIS